MKAKTPELLLIFHILLPTGNASLVAQVILCQIRAIHTTRKAEKKLNLDLDSDADEALREFLVSLWLNPGNATAYAYIELLAPHLGLFNYPIMEIRHKVASKKFKFSKHAVDQSVRFQIRVNEVAEAIANGQLIEDSSNNKNDSSYFICGLLRDQRQIYIKCSHITRPFVIIIAVYELP